MSAVLAEPQESTGRKVLNFLGFAPEGGYTAAEPVLRLFRQKPEPFQAIFTLDATNYETDAPKISEALQDYLPVILNLTGIKPIDGRRILDFSAGAVMVLGGSIRRVNKNVFVIAPPNVSLDDDTDDTESLLA